MTTRAEFDLAAKLAREYADDCEAIGDPVRALRRVVKSALAGNLDAIRTLGAITIVLNHLD